MSSDNMLKFIEREKQMPTKRESQERRRDFGEIYAQFEEPQAEKQAGRCSQCGIPFCQIHCPVSNNIPDWLMLTAEGRVEEAYQLSSQTNVLPEVCGRICPQDRLCEGNCVIEQSGHGTVTIGSIEKFITDTAWEQGWIKPIKPVRERSETVAIIGSGPGGIAAAARLRELGYQITIYDRYDRVGGLLIYGIPNFKLDKAIIAKRANWLKESGVKFKLNCEIGTDISFDDLRKKHHAVLIATGVYAARKFESVGSSLAGNVMALDYLIASNRKGLNEDVERFNSGELNAQGKNIVVIGGGDTAMDCVRTAVRQGAKEVTCLYRRDRANMPGSQNEVGHAEEEGVDFQWLCQPKAFMGSEKVESLKVDMMRLGLPDASGRQIAIPIKDQDMTLKADMVIQALGFEPENLPKLFNCDALPVTRWGTIPVDAKTGATTMDGVFAAGDIVRGASLVVWAIADGQTAAQGIHKYINASKMAASA